MHRTLPFAAALLLLASCGAPGPRDPGGLPNVVFLMADDMGWGDVKAYNPESLIETPNIDRLAEEGLVFTDAHSGAAVCSPTRYGILTGRGYWRTHKGHSLVMPYDPPVVPPERYTWARLMRDAGYTTAYVGKWHLGLWYPSKSGPLSPHQYTMDEEEVDFTRPVEGGPTELGFDVFFGNAGGPNNDAPYTFLRNDRWDPEPTDFTPPEMSAQPGVVAGRMAPGWSQEHVDERLTEGAREIIADHVASGSAKPLFLYYSLSAPHVPFTPPEWAAGASGAGPRGDMNVVVDWVVGQIRAELEEQGLLENTLFVFTSDNGPRQGANGHRSAGPWRGYKNTPYEGGHRVPFVVRWPGHVAAGSRSGVPLSLTDMMATFADLVQAGLPDDAAEDSWNVFPALLGDSAAVRERPALVAHTTRGEFAVRSGRWKLVTLEPSPQNGLAETAWELYDLEADPYETTDLSTSDPERLGAMKRLLERVRATGLRHLEGGPDR